MELRRKTLDLSKTCIHLYTHECKNGETEPMNNPKMIYPLMRVMRVPGGH